MIETNRDIAAQILAAFDSGTSLEAGRATAGTSPADGYRIAAALSEMRVARGARVIGRKIGFTNRTIWPVYGVDRPMWGEMYDTTVHEASAGPVSLDGFLEPRIEPEIAFGIARCPEPGLSDADLLACCDWCAHGFEIVQSPYPGWQFTTGEAIASGAMHGAFVMGPRVEIGVVTPQTLSAVMCTLSVDGAVKERGTAANVLDGPVSALRALVDGLAAQDGVRPIEVGDIITTGTMTDAYPIAPGERWSTDISAPLAGLSIQMV
ncbi:MAG: hydratase [Pseudomonadota bacterium]